MQATIVLASVLRQLGRYEEIKVLGETMPAVVELQDPRLEALLRERVADTLRDRGDLSEALTEYERVMRSTARSSRPSSRASTQRGCSGALGGVRMPSDPFGRRRHSNGRRRTTAIGGHPAARAEGALADGRGDTR